jgi:hypothetical protein
MNDPCHALLMLIDGATQKKLACRLVEPADLIEVDSTQKS